MFIFYDIRDCADCVMGRRVGESWKIKSRFRFRLEAATVRKTNQFPIINPLQGGNPPLAG
jgi:hypothetical protein